MTTPTPDPIEAAIAVVRDACHPVHNASVAVKALAAAGLLRSEADTAVLEAIERIKDGNTWVLVPKDARAAEQAVLDAAEAQTIACDAMPEDIEAFDGPAWDAYMAATDATEDAVRARRASAFPTPTEPGDAS